MTIDDKVYGDLFKTVYGNWIDVDPFLSKIETVEALRKGTTQMLVDETEYELDACCTDPSGWKIGVKEAEVVCVSLTKQLCKADLASLEVVSVRADSKEVGTVGESLISEMAINFKHGLTDLLVNGSTTLGIGGLLATISKSVTVPLNTSIFNAVLRGFENLQPNNFTGRVGIMLSPKSFNMLRVDLIREKLPTLNIETANSREFDFPALGECTVIVVNKMPDNQAVICPFANIVRLAGKISDDNFISINPDSIGNIVVNISTLAGLFVKNPDIGVIVNIATT